MHTYKIGEIFTSHPQQQHPHAQRLTNEMFSGFLLYNSLAEQSSFLAVVWMNECEQKGRTREGIGF
jgi:hypothetical protein